MFVKQKRLVLPFIEKSPHANILVRSFGIRHTGRSPLYHLPTVFLKSWNAVSSVNTVLFQLSFKCFFAHSTRRILWVSVNIGVDFGSFLLYPRPVKCVVIVVWEMSTIIAASLVFVERREIVESWRIVWPMYRATLGVIFLGQPAPFLWSTLPNFFNFFKFYR